MSLPSNRCILLDFYETPFRYRPKHKTWVTILCRQLEYFIAVKDCLEQNDYFK